MSRGQPKLSKRRQRLIPVSQSPTRVTRTPVHGRGQPATHHAERARRGLYRPRTRPRIGPRGSRTRLTVTPSHARSGGRRKSALQPVEDRGVESMKATCIAVLSGTILSTHASVVVGSGEVLGTLIGLASGGVAVLWGQV